MDSSSSLLILFAMLPFIAFLYASVGHGGASGYLALMGIVGFSIEIMKPTALILNVLVSGIAFIYFWKAGHFRSKIFFAFAAGSVPLSFIGGMIKVEPQLYKITLGVFLILATLKLLGVFDRKSLNEKENVQSPNYMLAVIIGALIGFLSGLIGIGGGIILSPVILLLRWSTVKESAAISALFIFVNSLSGLGGQLVNGITLSSESGIMIALAAVGGLAGSYFGTFKFNNVMLKRVLALVLLFASFKLIII